MIGGVPVDDVDMAETVDMIWRLVHNGRTTGRTHQVATVNVDFVVNALSDTSIASNLRATSLSIPDGMPLVWGARLIKGRLRTRVAGADLVPAIAARAAKDGTVIALIGAAPGIAEQAALLMSQRYPGVQVTGTTGPTFGEVDELSPEDLCDLKQVGADIACVAFGHPKQERFIQRFADDLGIPVLIGVGGSLDFLVGTKRRAPAWMQRAGLEWLHRAASEPRRLVGRYARDVRVFLPVLLRQAWVGRSRPTHRPVGVIHSYDVDGSTLIDVSAITTWDNAAAHRATSEARRAGLSRRSVRFVGVDTEATRSIPGLTELLRSTHG